VAGPAGPVPNVKQGRTVAPRTLTREEGQQIASAITRTREQRGWSRRELAEHAGTTLTNVHRMEGGHRGGMSISMVFTLVQALECSWREVLGAEPGSDGDHSTDYEAGFRAGVGESHGALSDLMKRRGLEP
jgi:transcriptional regulator with XRE-family HTH domain